MGFLESWYEDNISGKDGEYKGRGFGAAILKPFVDEEKIESKVQGNRNKQTATAAGYDLSELDVGPGATTLDVQGAAVRQGKADAEETKIKDHNRSMQPLQLQLAQQGKQSDRQHTATMTQLGNQNAIAMAGLTQSNNQFMAQMADSKDQRAMELQIRREELDRADARDSRNRRRESIAALTSGLAALGAAFAL
jgi:hypothetical protein